MHFHWWRHSHLVPVRWHRGAAAEAGVVQEAAQAALALEQAEQPEPQAAAPALLNPPVAKAVRVAIPRPNLPAARARIASILRGRGLGRGAPVPA